MSKIGRALVGAFDKVHRFFVPPYQAEVVEEFLPKKLDKRTLYIVEDDGFTEYAAMICPCGCREVLYMNLLQDERPCWKVIQNGDGTKSLHPSVWRQKDCRSHFWFRNGRVRWCSDSGPWWRRL